MTKNQEKFRADLTRMMANIRTIAQTMSLPYPIAMGSPQMALLFGDIVSVPTLFLFDRTGRTEKVFYGAPPDLHEQVSRAIAEAMTRSDARG